MHTLMFSNLPMTVTTVAYLWYHSHPYIPYKAIAEFILDKYKKRHTATIETQTDWAIDHRCYEVFTDDDGTLTTYTYVDNTPVYL